MIFRAHDIELTFPRPCMVMGIVNVTPDSFSDGGRFLEPKAAIDHALELVSEGAEIIDIGGESTRPRAEPVSEIEELRRVMPVLEALADRVSALISIDTYKVEVARQALRAGAVIVNDIAANRQEERMWEIVAEARAGYVAVHMQGTPQTMQLHPSYRNVCGEVGVFFEDRLRRLSACGVGPECVLLDVGIGFGKTREHNLELLANLQRFTKLGRPLLIGVSRKSFLGQTGDGETQGRLAPGLACACWGVQAGAGIIRTHDVKETLRAVRMTEEFLAFSKRSEDSARRGLSL